jgi:putative toxin-antitoxin system antitoxin component (TIGR02293 family)
MARRPQRKTTSTPADRRQEPALAARPSQRGQTQSVVRLRTAPAERLRADVGALIRLAAHGYSETEIADLVVPKRTLARRRAANEPLTIEEPDKALRLERVAQQAERVFGDPDKARRWMRKAKRALHGETPLAYLSSEAGARTVEAMLQRIEHGIFA